MPEKLFLYCPQTAPLAVVTIFGNRGFVAAKLTQNADDFFAGVNSVNQHGVLVLFSHGDQNGPLMVSGTVGENMSVDQLNALTDRLHDHGITFYCLSCYTGAEGTFSNALGAADINWVAPIGAANVKSSSETIQVFSTDKKGGDAGWAGTQDLFPSRKVKGLQIS